MTTHSDFPGGLSRRRLLGMAATGAAAVTLSACSTISNFPRYGQIEPVGPPETGLEEPRPGDAAAM